MSARAPLSVWPVAQQTARAQRRGRYLHVSTAHPGKMLPALAELPQRRGRRGRPSFGAALAEIFAGCRRLLAPGALLLVTARPYRRGGELIDLPGQLERLAAESGLELHDRLVALLCRLSGAE